MIMLVKAHEAVSVKLYVKNIKTRNSEAKEIQLETVILTQPGKSINMIMAYNMYKPETTKL